MRENEKGNDHPCKRNMIVFYGILIQQSAPSAKAEGAKILTL